MTMRGKRIFSQLFRIKYRKDREGRFVDIIATGWPLVFIILAFIGGVLAGATMWRHLVVVA